MQKSKRTFCQVLTNPRNNHMQYLKSKTVEIDDRILLNCRQSNQEWEVMVKGREVIADGDDHHNQPHSILVCVCDCDDDH